MAGPFNIIAQLQLQAPANLQSVVSQIQRSLSGITANVNIQLSGGSAQVIQQLNSQLASLQGNLQSTQAQAKSSSQELNRVGSSYSQVGQQAGQANSQLADTVVQMRSMSQATQQGATAMENFGLQAGLAARRYSAFLIAGGAIVGFVNSLRNGFEEALKFDREMVRLSQIGDTTTSDLRSLGDQVMKLATTWGVSSRELLQSTIQLRQAGLSANDTSVALEALAKSALSPSFGNLRDTTDGLIAAMNQFKLSGADAEKTLSAINAVSTRYKVSAEDIIDAIRRTGGAFHASGGNLNELIALFSAVRSTSQESAESIGSSLRTIFVRLQRSTVIEDLHHLGIELRYTREEAARMGNVNLTNQFVGPYQAIQRLSTAMQQIRSTDPRYAAITEELGGYRQISKVIPLLQEFSKTQQIYNTVQQSSNSITRSAEQAQEAFLIRIGKVREEFQKLINTITQSRGFHVFLDMVIQLASALTKLASVLTPLIPLIAAVATFKMAQGAGRFAAGLVGGFGGQSPKFAASGGVVPGFGEGDTVPAMLTPGEYVIRKQAAKSIGYDNLHRLNRYADGGMARQDKHKAYVFDLDETLIAHSPQDEAQIASMRAEGKHREAFGLAYGSADVVRRSRRGKLLSFAQQVKGDKFIMTARSGHPELISAIGELGNWNEIMAVGNMALRVPGKRPGTMRNATTAEKKQVALRDLLGRGYSQVVFIDNDTANIAAAAEIEGVKALTARSSRTGFAEGGPVYIKPGHRLGQLAIEGEGGGSDEIPISRAKGLMRKYVGSMPANMQSKIKTDAAARGMFFEQVDKYKAKADVDTYLMKSSSTIENIFAHGANVMDADIGKTGGKRVKGGLINDSAFKKSAEGYILESFISSYGDIEAAGEKAPLDFLHLSRKDRELVEHTFEPHPIKANELEAKRSVQPNRSIIIKGMNVDLFNTKQAFDTVVAEFSNKWFPAKKKRQGLQAGGTVLPEEEAEPRFGLIRKKEPELGAILRLTGPQLEAVRTGKLPDFKGYEEYQNLEERLKASVGQLTGRTKEVIAPGETMPEKMRPKTGPGILRVPTGQDQMFMITHTSVGGAGVKTIPVGSVSNFTKNKNIKKHLKDEGIDNITGTVNVYTISQRAKDEFTNEFQGPITNAIKTTFEGKFKGRGGSSVDFALSPQQTNSIMGHLFEKYIGGLFNVSSKGDTSYFDYTAGFGSEESPGLDKLLYPHGPVKGNLGDAKLSYQDSYLKDMAGKWLGHRAGKGYYSQGGEVDTVPALLTPGEYVINKESAQRIGYHNLDRLNRTGISRFADGGTVGGGPTPDIYNFISDFKGVLTVTTDNLRHVAEEAGLSAREFKNLRNELSSGISGFWKGKAANVEFNEGRAKVLGPTEAIPMMTARQEVEQMNLRNTQQKTRLTSDIYQFKEEPAAVIPPTFQQKVSTNIEAAQRAYSTAMGGQISELTKGQIAVIEINKMYQQETKMIQEAVMKNGGIKSEVEAARIAAERVTPQFTRLAETIGLDIKKGEALGEILSETAMKAQQALPPVPQTIGQQIKGGFRGTGRAIWANKGQIALAVGGAAAMYGASELESSAGTAEEAVAGGTEGRYTHMKAAGGALQGAMTGAAIGSMIPGVGTVAGGVVGGLIGAIGGLVTSFRDASKEIDKVTREVFQKKFSEAATKAAGGEETPEVTATLKQDMSQVRANIRMAEHLMGRSPKEGSFEEQRTFDIAMQKQGHLPQYEQIITGRAARLSTRGGATVEGTMKALESGEIAGESIEKIIKALAFDKGVKPEVIRKELEERVVAPGVQRGQAEAATGQMATTAHEFETMVLAIRNATSILGDFARSTQVMNDLFNGTITAVQNRNVAEGMNQFGGPRPEEFKRSVAEVTEPFGERGKHFRDTAIAVDTVRRSILTQLPGLLTGGTLQQTNLATQLGIAVAKDTKGAGAETARVAESAITRMSGMKEGDIQDMLRNSPDKLLDYVLGPLQGPIQQASQEIGKEMKAAADAFSSASATYQQQMAKVGEMYDRQAELQQQATNVTIRGRAELQGRSGGAMFDQTIEQAQEAFTKRQRRLTGNILVGTADLRPGEEVDPNAIGRRQQFAQNQVIDAQERLKAIAPTNTEEMRKATKELDYLKSVANNLGQALHHLTETAQRSAHIEEQLAALKKDRESRENVAEKFLTGDPETRLQMMRGRMLFETAARQGGMQGFGQEDLRAVQSFGQIAGAQQFGDRTVQENIRQWFNNLAPALAGPFMGKSALPNTNIGREAGLQLQKEQIANVGAAAQGVEAANAENMALKQFQLAVNTNKNVQDRLAKNMASLDEAIRKNNEIVSKAQKTTIEGAKHTDEMEVNAGTVNVNAGAGGPRVQPHAMPLPAGMGGGAGPVAGRASGGPIHNSGTDTVPAMLTPGEYVVNREATQANIGLLEMINRSHGKPIYLQVGGLAYERAIADTGSTPGLVGTFDLQPKRMGEWERGRRMIEAAEERQHTTFQRASLASGVGRALEKYLPGIARQYSWEESARAEIGRTQRSLSDAETSLESRDPNFIGFFERQRAELGIGAPSMPAMGINRQVVDARGNLIGTLIPGTDIVVTDRNFLRGIQKAGGARWGGREARQTAEDLVKQGHATHATGHMGWHIKRMAGGGIVYGSGIPDSTPAMLTAGEFVIGARAARNIGYDNLKKLNQGGPVGYYQGGGTVYDTTGNITSITDVRGNKTNYSPDNNLSQDIGKLQSVFSSFNSIVNNLANVITKLPPSIALTGNHNVNVNINGAEAFSNLQDSFKEMIAQHVNAAINNFISQRFPEIGTMTGVETQPLQR